MRFQTLPLLLATVLGGASVALAQGKPPANFISARANNYMRGRGGHKIKYVVIHTIEGSAQSGINTFRYGKRRVSAHYIVASDGAITQMVKDEDSAWHAGNSTYNRESIGIEHAGFADRNNWTRAQYEASAALTRWLCDTYGIPKDRAHILGHIEVPGATHHDPGRYFDWQLYIRLVRGEGSSNLEARQTRPIQDQMVGLLNVDWRNGDATGYPGLTVEWELTGTQQAARVLVEEINGSFRHDSGNLPGATPNHRLTARLQSGKRYRWKVRVTDGLGVKETDWATFRTDFTPPEVTALEPAAQSTVKSTPMLRWSYRDADGTKQVSYRIYVDDDADHTTVFRDSKELNGADQSYYPPFKLDPGKSYFWRVMVYDGRGNVAYTPWTTFTTSPDFQNQITGETETIPLSPAPGEVVAEERPLLRWSYKNGQQQAQQGFRILIARAGQIIVDEQYATPSAAAYRCAPLTPGQYSWRVGVWDGAGAEWSEWVPFTVVPPGTPVPHAGGSHTGTALPAGSSATPGLVGTLPPLGPSQPLTHGQ